MNISEIPIRVNDSIPCSVSSQKLQGMVSPCKAWYHPTCFAYIFYWFLFASSLRRFSFIFSFCCFLTSGELRVNVMSGKPVFRWLTGTGSSVLWQFPKDVLIWDSHFIAYCRVFPFYAATCLWRCMWREESGMRDTYITGCHSQ